MFFGWSAFLFVFEHAERLDDAEARVARADDVIHITAPCRDIRVGEIIRILALALGEFFGPMKEETDAFIRHALGMGGVGLATGEHARQVLALTMAADTPALVASCRADMSRLSRRSRKAAPIARST